MNLKNNFVGKAIFVLDAQNFKKCVYFSGSVLTVKSLTVIRNLLDNDDDPTKMLFYNLDLFQIFSPAGRLRNQTLGLREPLEWELFL